MTELITFATHEWRRLSAWSILHFAAKAIAQNVQALIFAGPATYGASRFADELAWIIPSAIIALVLIGSFLRYLFYSYRVLDDSVQVRRGALFRQNLNLAFDRIQNISIVHPFYFRPLGRVTLKIDGAGAKGEEVHVAALDASDAQAARAYILGRKRKLVPAPPDASLAAETEAADLAAESPEEAFFSRSLSDLIIHGLTNNRSFLLIAAALGFLSQSDLSPADMIAWLGIDFDVVIAGLSLVRLALLLVLSFIAAIGVIALLSVLVSIFTYYGFTLYRTADGLLVKRGLLTKHEIHVRKSRIQTVTLRQDWLDHVLGRRNVILERISHVQAQGDPWAAQQKKIFVPSVRVHETAAVTNEVLPGCRIDDLPFTPVKLAYFYKRALLASAFYMPALIVVPLLPSGVGWLTAAILAVWPLHIAHIYMTWRRDGLAVYEDYVIVRSGTIGIDYRIFPAYKVQDVTHIQSLLMRRRNTSSLRFHTASATIRVPHMGTSFMKSVVDYCVFRAETSGKSWM